MDQPTTRISKLVTIISLLTASLSMALAATTNLTPVADTSLFQPSSDNNLGGLSFMPIGVTGGGLRTRALVRFDLNAAIPAGSIITSASLNFSVVQSYAKGEGLPFVLHRVLAGWTEGTGTGVAPPANVGSPANPGEVTWNSRAHGTANWGQAGGQPGVDFLAIGSATNAMTATTLNFSSAALSVDVQRWLDNPGTNHGWIVLLVGETAAGSGSRLASKESTTKPMLTIAYDPPGSATSPTLFAAAASGSQFSFSFIGEAGRTYAIERRAPLASGWTTATNIPSLPSSGVIHYTNSLSGNEAYFRVRTP